MKELLERIINHESLTREETRDILVGITCGKYSNEQLTALLTGIQMRGITVDELLGFRDGILATGVPAILDCGNTCNRCSCHSRLRPLYRRCRYRRRP